MEKPLVSVSLVTFNQEEYIRKAIESCLNQQTDFDFEIIIHDDASSDGTPGIIQEYSSKYPDKIIPILQTENQFSKGIEVNGKIAIPKARGKYIAFLEADDYWIDPHKLQYQADVLEANPDVAMCFTATKRIFPQDDKKPEIKRFRNHDTICSTKDVILLGGRMVDMGSAVVRKSIYTHVPDWYFYIQIWDLTVPLLALLHGKIKYLDKVTSVYRYNSPSSWTRDNVKNYQRRKDSIKKSIRVTDGFDETTDYKYHKLIVRKIKPMIVELLLLSNNEDESFPTYYERMSRPSRLIYEFFKMIGSFRLWKFYRYTKRLLTGY